MLSVTGSPFLHHPQEAHMNGLALVTACAQEIAEEYCEQLRGAGLIASLEPDGGGGGTS